MHTIFFLWVSVGFVMMVLCLASLITDEPSPRETLLGIGKALWMSAMWPITLPMYFYMAVKRDEW